MKEFRNLIVCAVFLSSLLPIALAQSTDQVPKSSEMTVWRARRVLTCTPTGLCPNTKFTDESLTFELSLSRNKASEVLTINLKSLDKLSAQCKSHGFGAGKYFDCELQSSIGKGLERHDPVRLLFYSGYYGMAPLANATVVETVKSRGEMFVAALNRLREYAIHPESPLRNFSKAASEWRAMAAKPALY